jgi:hypothetical protein
MTLLDTRFATFLLDEKCRLVVSPSLLFSERENSIQLGESRDKKGR